MESKLKNVIKKAVKWFLVILTLVCLPVVLYLGPFLLLSPQAESQAINIKTVEDLDSYLSALVAEGIPPAIDVTVLKNGQSVFSKAYGVANGLNGEKANKENVYHYWSMTKSFTAVAVFQLIEQGKISLSDSITMYLPNFNPTDELGDPVNITIEQLLTHTSGLPDFNFKMAAWLHLNGEPRYGETRMVNERFQDFQTIVAQPGSASEYGNINFVILGAAIESVTGQDYEDYVRENILTPLKMADTDFVYRPDMLDKVAKGSHHKYHFWSVLLTFFGPEGGLDYMSDGVIENRHWTKLVLTDYAAATALIGSGNDMSRFGQMLLNQGELDGVRIISADSANKILHGGRFGDEKAEVFAGNKEVALGYGTKTWADEGVELIGHGGGGPGFSLQYFIIPEKNLVVVILLNQTLSTAHDIGKVVASVF